MRNVFLVKSIVKKGGRVMVTIISSLLICIIICVGLLMVYSPGKPKPFLDENGKEISGSISEKIHVKINGVEQGMFIKGKDKTKPVLLFVHGGPGMPEYVISQNYETVLENYFTVCWWEQRGAGLSFNSDISPDTITVDQLISDTIEVTNYLRNRFKQDKIYLMGHSWGSFIGIQTVAREPELYNAYIAISQMSRQLESEKLAYEYIVKQYKMEGNKKVLEKLENSPIDQETNLPIKYWEMREDLMHSLGIGTTHDMKSVITGIFLPVMKSPEYTLKEKINLWRYKFSSPSVKKLQSKMYGTDLIKGIQKLDVPVYFCHGIYDYTDSYQIAKEHFDKLQAPMKGFYTFNASAHSPLFEEPEKFGHILEEDVLNGTNNNADKK